MAKAYRRLRRERTDRRLQNQSFMEASKRPLKGKRKKAFVQSMFAKSTPTNRLARGGETPENASGKLGGAAGQHEAV